MTGEKKKEGATEEHDTKKLNVDTLRMLLEDETKGIRRNVIFALIGSILLVLAASLATFSVDVQEAATRNYILGSISQGLAAIFALIFTIALILSQILRTDVPEEIRRNIYIFRGTFILMFLFAAGIITPLLVMQSQSELLLDLCVILSSVCISSLIPYFLHVGNKWSHSTTSKIEQDEARRIHEKILNNTLKELYRVFKSYDEWKKAETRAFQMVDGFIEEGKEELEIFTKKYEKREREDKR